MEQLIPIGILVIIIGFILLIAGILAISKPKAKVEGGGVVFIGPIPIIGATSERALYLVIALSIIFLIIFLLISRRILGG